MFLILALSVRLMKIRKNNILSGPDACPECLIHAAVQQSTFPDFNLGKQPLTIMLKQLDLLIGSQVLVSEKHNASFSDE